jgi:hypothetical protein
MGCLCKLFGKKENLPSVVYEGRSNFGVNLAAFISVKIVQQLKGWDYSKGWRR